MRQGLIVMKANVPIRKTSGTLRAQIAYLKRQICLLEREQASSSSSPNRKAELIQEILKLRLQLQQLYQSAQRD